MRYILYPKVVFSKKKNDVIIGKRIKLLLILAPAGGQPFTRAIRSRAVGEHAIFIRRYYPI